MDSPLTDQQLDLDEIEARTDAATRGPWGFYDGDNYAEVAADMQVTSPGSCSYRERVARLEDEDYWDDQEHDGDDEERAPEQMAANAAFIAHAREDVPALLVEVRRLRAELAAFEMLAPQQCPAGKHADWLVDSEYAHACPWCRIADLEGPAVEARAALAALCYDLEDPGTAALGALYLISRVTTGVEAPRDEADQVLAAHDAQIMRRCAEFVRDTYDGEWADDAAATLERDADITERGCPGYEDAGRGDTVAERQLANCKHCGRPRAACLAASEATSAPLGASPASSVSESAQSPTGAAEGALGDSGVLESVTASEEQSVTGTLIGSITIRSESVQLDNGECLRDLAVGDSVELRPDTGHEGLWIAAAFHGDYQDHITLQYAEVVDDCSNDPAIACKFSGTRHAHPVDLDGKVRPRPTA